MNFLEKTNQLDNVKYSTELSISICVSYHSIITKKTSYWTATCYLSKKLDFPCVCLTKTYVTDGYTIAN